MRFHYRLASFANNKIDGKLSDRLHSFIKKYLNVGKMAFFCSELELRVAKSVSWSLLGGIVLKTLSVLTSIITARMIGKIGYGELGIILSTLGVLAVISGMGLGTSATKYIAELKNSNPDRAAAIVQLTTYLSIVSAAVMSIACFYFSPFIAENTLGKAELSSTLAVGSVFLFFTTISAVQSGTIGGLEAFKQLAFINCIQGIFIPLLTIPMVWMYSVNGAVAALAIHSAISYIILSITTKKQKTLYNIPKANIRDALSEWRIIIEFGLPAMLSGLMVVPVTWLTNLILIRQAGGYSELGMFTAANQWREVVLYLPGILTNAMLPVISSTHGKRDNREFNRAFEINLRSTLIVALPLSVFAVALNEPLGKLFGKNFFGVEPIIAVLMLASYFNIANAPIGTALAGAGCMWIGMLMNLLWGCILIFLAALWIPKYGAFGLGLAYLIAYLLHTIYQMIYVEIKIAPKVIRKLWRLISYSLILLSLSFYFNISPTYSFVYSAVLLFLSSAPLFLAIKKMISNK